MPSRTARRGCRGGPFWSRRTGLGCPASPPARRGGSSPRRLLRGCRSRPFLQVDGVDAVLFRQEVGELRLLDEAELREVVTDPAAGLLLLVLRLLQLLQRDEVFADQ